MLDHIAVREHSHRLRRLIVFSGDGRNFAEPLEDLSRRGTQVVVVAASSSASISPRPLNRLTWIPSFARSIALERSVS